MEFLRRRAYSFADRPTVDQHAQRLRRRRWLPNILTAEFDLGIEIAAVTIPLAARVAFDPVSSVYRGQVENLADAVAACVRDLDRLIGSGDDQRRTAHLSDDDRRRALDLLRTRRAGSRPEITDDDLESGAWSDDLVALAAPVSEPLSRLLGRSLPPAEAIPSMSERVEASLREVDRAALSLERRIDRRAADRELFATTRTSAISVEAELESLGVQL